MKEIQTGFPVDIPQMALKHGSMAGTSGSVFLACGMYTSSYGRKAKRLVSSLRQFNLPHAIFEVPAVHRSISPRGTCDPAYTKANFIFRILQMSQRPVLYLDVDCVVRSAPKLIQRLIKGENDFAIMNWLAQDNTEAYVPIEIQYATGEKIRSDRFFQFSYSIGHEAQDQLICSGAVQFWCPTPAAENLLARWHATIIANPGVPDDKCLDFALNNPSGDLPMQLKPFWLPKAYARYAYWIFDEPVIDHPEFPSSGDDGAKLSESDGRKWFYPERARPKTEFPRIPRDCLVDVKMRQIVRYDGSHLTPIADLDRPVWIS